MLYEPFLSENATATYAANASAIYSTPPDGDPQRHRHQCGRCGQRGSGTLTVLSGTTVIGVPVTVNVSAGAAAAVYVSPGGTPAGTYIIQAVYESTPNLDGSSDSTHSLTVTAATVSVTGVSVGWGSQTASLQTASDGLRLLPAGRANGYALAQHQPDIDHSQSGRYREPRRCQRHWAYGGDYGPMTISGPGTSSLVITLAKGITSPDRVTMTISNSQIITFTRRLDVLPGNFNDDGVVNTTDGVLLLRNFTPAHAYQQFYDLNGDAAVNTTDFNLYRPRIGTALFLGYLRNWQPAARALAAAARSGKMNSPPYSTRPSNSGRLPDSQAQDVALLRGVSAAIADLPVGYLGGTAIGGRTIYLSPNADGYGWFVDTTTGTNAEFGQPITTTELVANPSAPPSGHEDLLTVVMHELGHTLGLGDLDPARSPTDLMAETLATGVRSGRG